MPARVASTLTQAPHFSLPSVPVTARFSGVTGIPTTPDTDPLSLPGGFAIRFHLPEHDNSPEHEHQPHTDIISLGGPLFPTSTPEEFLRFLQASAASPAGTPSPTPLEEFLKTHPAAKRFVEFQHRFPRGLATRTYWAQHAFRLINGKGASTFVRYQLRPAGGNEFLSPEQVIGKGPNYLYDELPVWVAEGRVEFRLVAQVAAEDDKTDDITVLWPDSREIVELGTVKLDTIMPEEEQDDEQNKIVFDPMPRVVGIEPSADPILPVRSAAYLMSGRERRVARVELKR